MAKGASAWLRALARKMVDSYRSREDKSATSVMSAIVNDADYASDEERISDIIVYFAGGYDTTAYTLSWALLELARNPVEQEHLFRDLHKVPIRRKIQLLSLW